MNLSHLTPEQIKRRTRYGDPELSLKFAQRLANASEDELLALAVKSPAVHFACFTTIRNDSNEKTSPIPNELQLRMSQAYETVRELGIRVRIQVVKPRRAGCSTFAAHIGYHHGMNYPIEGITISDIKDHSTELMDKLKEYGETDVFPWKIEQVQSSSKSMEWSNGTKWTVDTAENPDAGVGGTRQFGHFSEVAKWPQTQTRNDKKTMSAVMPSLSGQDTVVIAESTPENAAGWHFDNWQDAVWLWELVEMVQRGIRPEEIWVKVFAAWYEFASNSRQQPVSEQEIKTLKATLTDHEKKEIELYGLTWEQIAWRRDTIKAKCNGDPRIFSYYYPSDDVTCWLSSGSPRFDMNVLSSMKVKAEMVIPETGYLIEQDTGEVTFSPVHDGSGIIQVWERPQPGMKYLVAIDPATDESQTVGADPDRHSVNVWRAAYHDPQTDVWKKAMKVARLRPPFYGDGDEVAEYAIHLSKYYGKCIATIEINCGLDIMRLLKLEGIPLYKRRPLSHRTGTVVEQIGFKMTDKEERNYIIEGLAAAIRTESIDVYCQHTIREYMTFIINTKRGRAEAARGAHDDDVLADAIAWETLPSATTYQIHSHRLKEPADRKRWKTVTSIRRGYSK